MILAYDPFILDYPGNILIEPPKRVVVQPTFPTPKWTVKSTLCVGVDFKSKCGRAAATTSNQGWTCPGHTPRVARERLHPWVQLFQPVIATPVDTDTRLDCAELLPLIQREVALHRLLMRPTVTVN